MTTRIKENQTALLNGKMSFSKGVKAAPGGMIKTDAKLKYLQMNC